MPSCSTGPFSAVMTTTPFTSSSSRNVSLCCWSSYIWHVTFGPAMLNRVCIIIEELLLLYGDSNSFTLPGDTFYYSGCSVSLGDS